MNRIGLGLALVALAAAATAAVRARELSATVAEAEAVEAHARAIEADVARLRRLPGGARAAEPITDALRATALGAGETGLPLGATVRLASRPAGRRPARSWAPLSTRPLEVSVDTGVSRLAALDWLAALCARYPVAIDTIAWDGRRATIAATVLGR